MTLPPSKIGDKGQRFVIQATNWPEEGLECGWQNIAYSEKPAPFDEVQRAVSHPAIKHLRVLDRSKDGPLARLLMRLGNVKTKSMGGDNLAVTLCGLFADADEIEEENSWGPSAQLGAEEVLFAIHEQYSHRIRELGAQIIALGGTPT